MKEITHNDWIQLSESKQNQLVAELSGWKDCVSQTGITPDPNHPSRNMPHRRSWRIVYPNYVKDLNGMHEAEKTLSPQERHMFKGELDYMFNGDVLASFSASAIKRAEAFVIVKTRKYYS
jgi:hypothetical protein